MTAGAPALALPASGSPGEGGSSCPSSNPPNQMTLVAGTPQTATLDAAFATGLQVALTNTDGCPVTSAAAGVPVTFTGPAAGAGGRFSASDANVVTVGADASGDVAAPAFTANATAGSYTVTASSAYGSVSFALTNTATGIPARLAAIALASRSATVNSRFAKPLQVRVLDAGGEAVPGASVTFTLGAGGTGTCGTSAAAGASFAGGGMQATATSDAGGIATSAALTANTAVGSFTATASFSLGGGAEGAGRAAGPTPTPALFSLVNVAGRPAKIAPGVGATQSTPAGAVFPIRLAVTVTDTYKNPVARARVTFSAPAAGASGHFTLRSRRSHHRRSRISRSRTIEVETGACGIAVAPPFTAGPEQGGYVVKAAVRSARPGAFALVNEAP
ncbi:MAG TPA: hypothetical protein VHT27_12905 [Solirubrobacteraceae bacterium]|nr:hypothetical protein [Solirubrobacteraceae bacterium]